MIISISLQREISKQKNSKQNMVAFMILKKKHTLSIRLKVHEEIFDAFP